jgi:glycosyltransferase involved in cell wall biosynthesis
MADLSILIPSRNEMFLAKTIEDILKNIEGDTEIIAVLDGAWADPPIPDNPRVTLIHHSESIGQRAATNEAAKLSRAKYVMKVDAHCAFDKGFDVKMMQEMHDDWTMVPLMRNLHAFDWVCPDGHRRYQGPSGPCQAILPDGRICGKETVRDIVWIAKESPKSVSYCFDSTPHFQYFGEFQHRPEGQGDITETMSLQGSCWMLTRQKYWELGVCDENFGSWGSQGIEVAVKTWLSGGRVVCNKKTWYAHMFRTQGGDFSFPYPISGRDQEKAKSYARDLFFNNKWEKQIHPLSWLIEKFWPVPGWSDEDLQKLKANTFRFKEEQGFEPAKSIAESEPAPLVKPDETKTTESQHESGFVYINRDRAPSVQIVYYSDSELDPKIDTEVKNILTKISQEKKIPIISCTLKKDSFGDKNIHFPHLKRGILTMFKQIQAGLEHSTADFVFLCEADVLYHPSHFDFRPPSSDLYYYNKNCWQLRIKDGFAVYYEAKRLSQICADRNLLLQHYRKRIELVEKNGFSRKMGFEPGSHGRAERVDDIKSDYFISDSPNIDLAHDTNITGRHWSPNDFRDPRNCKNWVEGYEIPTWGNTKRLIKRFN